MTFAAAAVVFWRGAERLSRQDLRVTEVSVRPEKPCNECGRPAPYVIKFNGHRWGWRLCWKHVPSLEGLCI